MIYKTLPENAYFAAPANPTQVYQKLNDNHAYPVPANTTLELGRVIVHVDPKVEVIEVIPKQEPVPPPTPKQAK